MRWFLLFLFNICCFIKFTELKKSYFRKLRRDTSKPHVPRLRKRKSRLRKKHEKRNSSIPWKYQSIWKTNTFFSENYRTYKYHKKRILLYSFFGYVFFYVLVEYIIEDISDFLQSLVECCYFCFFLGIAALYIAAAVESVWQRFWERLM